MNDATKIKWLTGTTVLLIILNIVIVSFVWFAPHALHRERDHGGPAKFIIQELNFNQTQREQFEKLKDEHHNLMMMINERDRHIHDALFELVKNGHDSMAISDSLINQIAENRKQIESVTYHHLAAVRKICTAAQQKKFDTMIHDLMTRIGGAPPTPHENQ
jgi:Spy/CpxP family protein refolding chaperone